MKKKMMESSGSSASDIDVDNISTTLGSSMFPDEIMSEILSRLPVKSLYRFKCVRKSWQSLIEESPHFVDLHINQSKMRPSFLVHITSKQGRSGLFSEENFEEGISDISSPLLLSSPQESMLTPVNGLICFANHKEGSVRIINLSTHQETPRIKTMIKQELKARGVFYYVEIKCRPLYGFGFDPITKEHKVICIRNILRAKPSLELTFELFQFCEVLTVGDNTWRRFNGVLPPNRLQCGDAVHVSGSIYWKSCCPFDTPNLDAIVAFDVGNEKFKVIPLPKSIRDIFWASNVFVGNDPAVDILEVDRCVALIGRINDSTAKLWILEDDHEEMSNINTTSTSSSNNWNVIAEETISSLPIAWDEKDKLSFQAIAGTERMILHYYTRQFIVATFSYDRKKKTFINRFDVTTGSTPHYKSLYFTTLFESLLPVQRKQHQYHQSHPQPEPEPASTSGN